jgi:hypothetical protein
MANAPGAPAPADLSVSPSSSAVLLDGPSTSADPPSARVPIRFGQLNPPGVVHPVLDEDCGDGGVTIPEHAKHTMAGSSTGPLVVDPPPETDAFEVSQWEDRPPPAVESAEVRRPSQRPLALALRSDGFIRAAILESLLAGPPAGVRPQPDCADGRESAAAGPEKAAADGRAEAVPGPVGRAVLTPSEGTEEKVESGPVKAASRPDIGTAAGPSLLSAVVAAAASGPTPVRVSI